MSIMVIEVDFNADAIGAATVSEVESAIHAACRSLVDDRIESPVLIGSEVVGRAYWRGGLLVMSSVWDNE